MAAGRISDSRWGLGVLLFGLVVFVISPVVLLIRERPLRGIDEWMPGGRRNKSSADDRVPEPAGPPGPRPT